MAHDHDHDNRDSHRNAQLRAIGALRTEVRELKTVIAGTMKEPETAITWRVKSLEQKHMELMKKLDEYMDEQKRAKERSKWRKVVVEAGKAIGYVGAAIVGSKHIGHGP